MSHFMGTTLEVCHFLCKEKFAQDAPLLKLKDDHQSDIRKNNNKQFLQ